MLKGLGDLGNLMKLQKEFKNTQKRIAQTTMEGESPDGMVKITMNGEYKLLDVKIDGGIHPETDGQKLEMMILAAVNNGVKKIKDFSASENGEIDRRTQYSRYGEFL